MGDGLEKARMDARRPGRRPGQGAGKKGWGCIQMGEGAVGDIRRLKGQDFVMSCRDNNRQKG